MTQEHRADSGTVLAANVLPRTLTFQKGCLDWSRPYVMGVLNVTPDSFSDGGRLQGLDAAVAQARQMVAAGADILDIGGESTRPGARPVSAGQECERVLPLIERLSSELGVLLSVDTCKAEVARLAVQAGVEIVNDVSGGRFDPAMIETVTGLECAFVCGHVDGSTLAEVHASRGASAGDIRAQLSERIAGLPASLRARTIADPCLGFGKDLQANLELLAECAQLRLLTSCPVLIGASRKRFLGEITGQPVGERDAATIGACLAGIRGGANIVRVHNVAMTVAAVQVYCAAGQAA